MWYWWDGLVPVPRWGVDRKEQCWRTGVVVMGRCGGGRQVGGKGGVVKMSWL